MLVEKLKDQWTFPLVGKDLYRCPDCCEEKRTAISEGRLKVESSIVHEP